MVFVLFFAFVALSDNSPHVCCHEIILFVGMYIDVACGKGF